MDRRHLTDNELRALEMDARRLRAEALRDLGLSIANWFRGFARGASPKGGRTA